jgi:hypothetical protein
MQMPMQCHGKSTERDRLMDKSSFFDFGMAYKLNEEISTIGISSSQQPTVLGRLVIFLYES